MMGNELRPCPFCGSSAFVTINFGVMCEVDRCLHLPPRASREDAIAAWNRRADPAPTEDEIERVARAIIAAGYNPATAVDIARAAIAAMRQTDDH